MGFRTTFSCSRCFKEFEGEGYYKSYADFDRATWPKWSNTDHRLQVEEVLQANTLTERQRLHGVRYSSLLKLPYYDAIWMYTIIGPLHKL